jgi:hypothetical protein
MNGCLLNPSRLDPERREDPAVQAAAARLADHVEPGLGRLADLGREPLAGERVAAG